MPLRKFRKRKKEKKESALPLVEGKCDAIFFCKKDGRTIFHGYLFFKKPFRA